MPDDGLPVLCPGSPDEWDAWLTSHHADSAGLWLKIPRKGSGAPGVSYPDALRVALCHGWIDGQTRRRDEATYMQRFTPRRSRSRWSKRNVAIAERLGLPPAIVADARGRLTEGQVAFEETLASIRAADLEARTALDRARSAEIKAAEHRGYAFEAADASFELLVRRVAGRAPAWFELEGYRVVIERSDGPAGGTGGSSSRAGTDRSEAIVRLVLGQQRVLNQRRIVEVLPGALGQRHMGQVAVIVVQPEMHAA